MHRRSFKGMPLESAANQQVQGKLSLLLMSIAVGCCLGGVIAILRHWQVTPLLLGLALIFSVFAAGASFLGYLPLQNVMGACLVAAVFGGAAHAATHEMGIPFGPIVYSRDSHRLLFGVLIWPLTWAFCLLACRGVARCLVRPLRGSQAYGLWQLSATGVLMVLTGFSMELLGARALLYWGWAATKWPVKLAQVPVVVLAGWVLVSLLILAFATPILINKKPGPTPPPGWQPLMLWVGIEALPVAALITRGYPLEGLLVAGCVTTIGVVALTLGLSRSHSRAKEAV